MATFVKLKYGGYRCKTENRKWQYRESADLAPISFQGTTDFDYVRKNSDNSLTIKMDGKSYLLKKVGDQYVSKVFNLTLEHPTELVERFDDGYQIMSVPSSNSQFLLTPRKEVAVFDMKIKDYHGKALVKKVSQFKTIARTEEGFEAKVSIGDKESAFYVMPDLDEGLGPAGHFIEKSNLIPQEEFGSLSFEKPVEGFSVDESRVIFDRLDELMEKLQKLEIGLQLTYDDLNSEISELKDLVTKLNKKNWFEMLQGKMVSIGLGKLTDEAIKVISETLKDQKLIS